MSVFTDLKNRFDQLFVHKDTPEPRLESKETKTWRTRHYRSRFEGYSEVYEPRADGTSKSRMVYTAPYYAAHMSDAGWRMKKLFYFMLALLSAMLWGLYPLQHFAINAVWYGYLPEVAALCTYLMLLRFLIERCFAPRKMIVREYRQAVSNIKYCCIVQLVLLALSTLIVLIHTAATGAAVQLKEAASFALAGVCIYVIYNMETHIVYDKLENPDKARYEGFYEVER